MRKRTRSSVRAVVVTLVAGLLMPPSARAEAQEALEPPSPNPAVVAFDILIVRPLTLVVVPIGVAAFIPAALLTAPNGKDSVQQALELFVTGPAYYVFQRPLGEI